MSESVANNQADSRIDDAIEVLTEFRKLPDTAAKLQSIAYLKGFNAGLQYKEAESDFKETG